MLLIRVCIKPTRVWMPYECSISINNHLTWWGNTYFLTSHIRLLPPSMWVIRLQHWGLCTEINPGSWVSSPLLVAVFPHSSRFRFSLRNDRILFPTWLQSRLLLLWGSVWTRGCCLCWCRRGQMTVSAGFGSVCVRCCSLWRRLCRFRFSRHAGLLLGQTVGVLLWLASVFLFHHRELLEDRPPGPPVWSPHRDFGS